MIYYNENLSKLYQTKEWFDAYGLVQLLDKGFEFMTKREQWEAVSKFTGKVNAVNCGMFMMQTRKSEWPQAVQIINSLGYPQNKEALPYLMELLLDPNWPGSQDAMSVLSKVEKSCLLPLIEKAIHDAYSSQDDLWLLGIQMLVDITKISRKDFANQDLFTLLKFADGEW